jgi:hypothetical protein
MTAAQFGALLTAVVRHFPGRKKTVAMFEAYLDGSDTVTGEPAATLSGLVAPAKRWKSFAVAWDQAMKRGGAGGKILHMADFALGYRDFTGWTEPRRKALLTKLVPVLLEHVCHAFCPSIPLRYWEEIQGLSPDRPKHAMTPLLMNLQVVMEGIVELVKPAAADPVICFMEEDRAVEANVIRHFHYLRVSIPGWKDLFSDIIPLKKGPAPLQAADLVAYEGSRHISEQVVGKGAHDPRGSYRALEKSPKLHFAYIGREGLAKFAANSILAMENAARYPGLKAEIEKRFLHADRKMHQARNPHFGKPLPAKRK